MRLIFVLALLLLVFTSLSSGNYEVVGQQVISERVNLEAEDGAQLTGRLDRPKSEPMGIGIILVHGFGAGIDYPMMNRFSTIFASNGFVVLSLNMRRSQIFATSKFTTSFEDGVKDIRAAIQIMAKRGFTQIFLGGHSAGGHEVTYYVAETGDQAVVALGLYAAGGSLKFAVQRFIGEQEYNIITNKARDLVAKGSGDEIVYGGPLCPPHPGCPRPVPFSAKAWLSWFGPESKLDTVRSIRSVLIPVLILVHEKDPPLSSNKSYFENAIASRKADLKIYTTPTTSNPHHFEGFEDQVVQDTVDWLKANLSAVLIATTMQTTATTTTKIPQQSEGEAQMPTESIARPAQDYPPYIHALGVAGVSALVIGIILKRRRHI